MFQDTILKAIGELPRNDNRYIKRVWLHARPKRFNAQDSTGLKNQIFELIGQVEASWSAKPKWDQSCRKMINDLSGFPILDKYLDCVEAFPRREPIDPERVLNEPYPDRRWIAFPNRGGAYTLDAMLAPLMELLIDTKNDNRYRDICKHVELDECFLLIHYDFDAFQYNTPIDVPDHSFKDVAEFAKRALADDGGFFQRIFLLNCLQGAEEAHRLL